MFMRMIMQSIAVSLTVLSSAVCAQTFPSKPIRIIVAFPPGGGTDIVARMVAPRLGEALGTQVIVDNRAGAQGVVGTEIVAKSPPDGHTLFMGTLGNLSVNTALYGSKLPFNIERDFAPITQVVDVTFIQMIHPSLPAKNPRELIALAKSQPGVMNYYSSGSGGAPHLAAEMFNALAGVRTTHVPYKGSAPGQTDLMAGQVQLGYDSIVQSLPFVKAGKLRALAVLGTKRSPVMPELPPMRDFLPGYALTNWFALVAPAATPAEIRTRLNVEVVKILRSQDIKERLLGLGAEPVGSSQEEFGAFIKAETAKWGKVIRDANIKADQ
jgi:tripartite-type tricarboxylate transporter receptor subunit TctC